MGLSASGAVASMPWAMPSVAAAPMPWVLPQGPCHGAYVTCPCHGPVGLPATLSCGPAIMAVACHSVMLCQPVMCHRVMPAIVSGTCQNGRPSDRVLRASDSTPVSGPGLRLRPLGWILAGLRGCSVGPMPWTHGATLKRPCQGEFHGSAHGKGPSGEGRLGFGPRAHVGKPWPTENGPTWKARKPRSTGPRKKALRRGPVRIRGPHGAG